MDLLKGYGSDDSSASSSSSSTAGGKNTHTTVTASVAGAGAPPPKPLLPKPTKSKRGGKRILSLGAVLPPEIFDRLTRPPEDDDSSTSSYEGAGAGGAAASKKRKRLADDHGPAESHNSTTKGGGDRSELNSLLSELRSTPLHVTATKTTKVGEKPETKPSASDDGGRLGMAFMSYTTTTKTKKNDNEVVDVHAVHPVKRPAAKPSVEEKSMQQPLNEEGENTAKPAPPAAAAMPTFSRLSAAAPVSLARNIPQYPQASSSSVPEYSAADSRSSYAAEDAPSFGHSSGHYNDSSGGAAAPKSRKQRREEERALRSGQAIHSATEIYQPSPTEFAPTAHAAAIASKAARLRGAASGGGGGGGGGGVGNIAMYDPKSGTDVKGMGVTGKHRSKHQINQLMASAISLEAHRASEAELARFGMGSGAGSGKANRADGKKKYGW